MIFFIREEVIFMEENKRNRLLSSAYNLFINKGINKTTIQDIVDAARVAKGTFYLYFEDKYKLQEELVIEKSKELFNNALEELSKHKIKKFDDQIIFILDYVIDSLASDVGILNFISKDLSLGLYQEKLTNLIEKDTLKIYDMFMKGAKENKIKKPEIALFMIIEFFSATVYSVLTHKMDITISEYKTYMHKVVKNILNN